MQKIILALVLLGVQVTLGQRNQRAVLYERTGQQGEYLTVPQTYVADLGAYNFDNRAYSTCVTGVWLFYVERNYNEGRDSGMEYIFGPNNYCVNFRTVGGLITSVRFVGSPQDYSASTITIFKGNYFQEDEEYTFNDLPSLNLEGNHASLILTGESAWTVYDGRNYQGNAICLYPPSSDNFTPYFLSDITSVSIPHGSIKSLRKGCFGKTFDQVSNFARAGEKV